MKIVVYTTCYPHLEWMLLFHFGARKKIEPPKTRTSRFSNSFIIYRAENYQTWPLFFLFLFCVFFSLFLFHSCYVQFGVFIILMWFFSFIPAAIFNKRVKLNCAINILTAKSPTYFESIIHAKTTELFWDNYTGEPFNPPIFSIFVLCLECWIYRCRKMLSYDRIRQCVFNVQYKADG